MRSMEAGAAQMKVIKLLDSVLRCSCMIDVFVVGDKTSFVRADDETCVIIDCSRRGIGIWVFRGVEAANIENEFLGKETSCVYAGCSFWKRYPVIQKCCGSDLAVVERCRW